MFPNDIQYQFYFSEMVLDSSKSRSKIGQDLINYEMSLMDFSSFLAEPSDAAFQYLFNLRAKYLIARHL